MSQPEEQIRVLCVDDDPWQLQATKIFFEPENDILVRTCSSTDEALKEILHNEFDCLVIDYRMQSISGIELVRNIRHISNVPIIMYSMFDEKGIVDAALSAGANRFNLKNSHVESFRRLAEEIRRLTGIS